MISRKTSIMQTMWLVIVFLFVVSVEGIGSSRPRSIEQRQESSKQRRRVVGKTSRQPALLAVDLYPISKDGKWGYIDKSGKVLVRPQFESAFLFSDGLAAVSRDGQKYGFIDSSGNFMIEPRYDFALPFREGLAMVRIGDKVGYVGRTGRLVIPTEFEFIRRDEEFLLNSSFSEGLAAVALSNHKCGYVDKKGGLLSVRFDSCSSFAEGLAPVRIDINMHGHWGFIDSSGRMAISPRFESAWPFTQGLALVKSGNKFGYMNNAGRLVIRAQFDSATPFSAEGIAGVRINNKWGGIDKTGKIVIAPQFDGNFMTAMVINVPFVGDLLARDLGRLTYSEGLAPVKIGGQSGYINRTGSFVIRSPQFDVAFPFINGRAAVVVGGYIRWIDKTGKYIWNPMQ